MYIVNPVFHEGLMKYVSYTLTGEAIKEQITRRYSDFFALREKLKESWPGIYIPNLPPKQSIGNTDKNFIRKRLRLMNKFLYKISGYSFLNTCEEVVSFQTCKDDYAKTVGKKKEISVSNILDNFKAAFPDYPENYDILIGKSRIKEFDSLLRKTASNLKTFHEGIQKCVEKRDEEMEDYFAMMKEMEKYEIEVLKPLAENKDDKLIFANPASPAPKQKADDLEKILNNPFVALDGWLEEERLDIDAAIESIESLNNLNSRSEKMGMKIESIDSEIKQLQYGSQGFLSGIFKSKEAKMSELENSKTSAQDDMQKLIIINKMAHYRMEQFIGEFKEEKANSYYKTIKLYAYLQRDNNLYNKELWTEAKNALNAIKPS